jgi:hypothetical protein
MSTKWLDGGNAGTWQTDGLDGVKMRLFSSCATRKRRENKRTVRLGGGRRLTEWVEGERVEVEAEWEETGVLNGRMIC